MFFQTTTKTRLVNQISSDVRGWSLADIDAMITEAFEGLDI
jgi:hypothetical protein